jgi:signal transduction histidine kinase
MRTVLRFFNEANEFLAEESFSVHGQTPGWTGRFIDSRFVSRRERVNVPAYATRVWVVISSAGPPEAIGAYAVKDLVISQPSTATNALRLIPPMGPDSVSALPGHNPAPPGWIRDGLRLGDAQVVRCGPDGEIGLAIVDTHVDSHVDWATLKASSIATVPGEPLQLEWKEAYSIGRGDYGDPTYQDVPVGLYRFRMTGLTVMGLPTGVEASIPISIPTALWTTPVFWSMVALASIGFVLAGWRFVQWRRMVHQVEVMERNRAVEQERVRIAQDIHDDLGARVTQFSLLSSAAQNKPGLTDQAREDFEQVSRLSRNMVTALYETVWAVEPENDHLDELGAYICQMSTQMCSEANLKCRLTVPDMPRDVALGSKVRHEIIMAVKEAVHNVLRHSGAKELHVRILYENRVLTIIVSDDGSGFDLDQHASGNGLSNMKRRMGSCDGSCVVRSRPGEGTQVRLELSLTEN